MTVIRQIAGRLRKLASYAANKESKRKVTIKPVTRLVQGRALLSYLVAPVTWRADDPRFANHSANWESREIALILKNMGYITDCINWDDQHFLPSVDYDIVLDICLNLQRLAPFLKPNTIKILHCTGSDPFYQNHAEVARVRALEHRRHALYSPKPVFQGWRDLTTSYESQAHLR